MGGPGSGSWYRWSRKDTVEEHRSLDVNRWHREGLLRPWQRFGWVWKRNGEEEASISVATYPEAVELSYTIWPGTEDAEKVRYVVPITWTGCNYGGRRPWFVCPNTKCGRRVGKLYLRGRYFLCRHCHDLVYESQRIDDLARLIRRKERILKRWGKGRLASIYPKKPKGMHWKTYDRLLNEAYNLELAIGEALAARFEKWMAITEGRKGKQKRLV